MLKLEVPAREWFDDKTQQFLYADAKVLTLEHSLLSLSKWESKWKIPFLDPKKKITMEQNIDYVRCMTIGNVPDMLVYYSIPQALFDRINAYINDPMTATKVNRKQKPGASRHHPEIPTSELIYFWMVSYNIPFECEKWHLNRLLTLIDVCSFKNETPKKMSPKELAQRNSALNAARRAKHNSKG